ncbi:hypothetical protein OESDEN_08037 [Oesophagostomum dentatum]|uniref:Choline transporter-like protein n=1 Tax=Oesophagostomum dentatum TaxID=61180 RepID=A0A0B1T3E8_OESDE|nr:hypothetical protein OESDEN_08037 [Oesophagostomum dentatum]
MERIRKLAAERNNSLCVDHSSALASTNHQPRFGVCPRLPVLKRAIFFSTDIMNRCIPEDLIGFGKDLFKKVLEMDWIRGYLHDLIDASPYLLQMCLVALVLALLSVALLRFFAPIIIYFVYLAVATLAVGFSGCIWYAFWKVYKKAQKPEGYNNTTATSSTSTVDGSKPLHLTGAILLKDLNFEELFNFEDTTSTTLFALGLGATVISVFVVLIVWCILPRGKKMVRLFKGASKALAAMPSLLLQPLINAALVLMVAIYTMSIVLVLFTAGDLVSRRITNGDGKNDSIFIIESNMTQTTKWVVFSSFHRY